MFCSFFALVACSENKIADKPENSAVYDQAKVLSKETIKTIDKLNEEADNTDKKLKIGVYITKDLGDKNVEETSLEVARKWKIGDKDTNNGVLLFLAIKDKKSRLEVSDNLATRLTDVQSKAILDNMKPKLRVKDYDGAVLDAVKSITHPTKTSRIIRDDDDFIIITDGYFMQMTMQKNDSFTFFNVTRQETFEPTLKPYQECYEIGQWLDNY